MMPAGAQFVIVHHGAVGDFVLTFPLLRSLAPHPVALVAPASRGRLAARCFSHVRPVDGDRPHWVALFGRDSAAVDAGRLREDLAAGPESDPAGGTRIVSFVSGPDDPWTRHMARALPDVGVTCVVPRPPASWADHVTAWHAHQLRLAGWRLDPGVPPPARPADPTGPLLLHVGSGGRAKCWPQARWTALVRALERRGRPLEVIFGEAEQERWTAAERAAWRRLGATCLETLDGLYERLEACAGFVGHDSGPTHLAAQMGVPTVALFGPTRPQWWAPRGPAVTVLAPDAPAPMSWLGVDAVAHAASTL